MSIVQVLEWSESGTPHTGKDPEWNWKDPECWEWLSKYVNDPRLVLEWS